jgi:methylglutaconyl-CoA hydratase
VSTLLVTPGPVAVVTLNRPDVRNAFNDVMIAELTAWARSVTPGSLRAAILQGAGPVFCAGADLQWMSRMAGFTRAENVVDAERAALMLQALDQLPVPLIGRIHGAALGGGAGLAALCDVVVAADDASFGFTETTLGIVPALISPYIVRKIGFANARALCVSGVRFSAARAREIGLITDVVPATGLDEAVDRHVQQFLKASPTAMAATKRLLAQVHGQRPSDVVELTIETLADQRVSPEGQEGMRAFLEKRPAAWIAGAAAPRRPPR